MSSLPASRARKPTSIRRLRKEVADMTTDPPPNCSAGPTAGNLYEWTACIKGPPNTPYEGGKFLLQLKFPASYPFSPPKVTFRTRIYHCNINSQGLVCMSVLRDEWTPALSVATLLVSLSTLLANPNPDDPLVGSIAKQYRSDKQAHNEIAKLWTQRYAR